MIRILLFIFPTTIWSRRDSTENVLTPYLRIHTHSRVCHISMSACMYYKLMNTTIITYIHTCMRYRKLRRCSFNNEIHKRILRITLNLRYIRYTFDAISNHCLAPNCNWYFQLTVVNWMSINIANIRALIPSDAYRISLRINSHQVCRRPCVPVYPSLRLPP